jgi:hypothetical protein
MAQMHFYVPDDFAREIRRRAKQARMPVSKYLVQVIMNEIGPDWPDHYFDDVPGSWNGDSLDQDPRD